MLLNPLAANLFAKKHPKLGKFLVWFFGLFNFGDYRTLLDPGRS